MILLHSCTFSRSETYGEASCVNFCLQCSFCFLLVRVAQQAMNNDSVIKLVKAGLSDDLIVTTINGRLEPTTPPPMPS